MLFLQTSDRNSARWARAIVLAVLCPLVLLLHLLMETGTHLKLTLSLYLELLVSRNLSPAGLPSLPEIFLLSKVVLFAVLNTSIPRLAALVFAVLH